MFYKWLVTVVNLNIRHDEFGQLVSKGNLVDKTTIQTSNFAPEIYTVKLENGKVFNLIRS